MVNGIGTKRKDWKHGDQWGVFTVTQMSASRVFHWGWNSWIVRSELVPWQLEPTGGRGLDMGRERKERKESRITTEFWAWATGWVPVSCVKGEVTWGHLCQGVLRWSWEAIKWMGLMHSHWWNPWNSELGQTANIARTQPEHLQQ